MKIHACECQQRKKQFGPHADLETEGLVQRFANPMHSAPSRRWSHAARYEEHQPKHIKHKRVVSISLYLPEKVWVEMPKTQHFETYENCIFIILARQT